jgi:hypothetical protein
MDIFGKCSQFRMKLEYLKSRNQFFYLRELDPTATSILAQKGKKCLMLGLKIYVGLVNHADA